MLLKGSFQGLKIKRRSSRTDFYSEVLLILFKAGQRALLIYTTTRGVNLTNHIVVNATFYDDKGQVIPNTLV